MYSALSSARRSPATSFLPVGRKHCIGLTCLIEGRPECLLRVEGFNLVDGFFYRLVHIKDTVVFQNQKHR